VNTDTVSRIGACVDDLCDDLDRIVGRICRHDPVLSLELESGKFWLIVDTANLDPHGDSTVMMRSPDRGSCIRFAHAFARKHPETILDSTLAGDAKAGRTVSPVIPHSSGPESPAENHSVKVPVLRVVV
jgi:hypothetical protein